MTARDAHEGRSRIVLVHLILLIHLIYLIHLIHLIHQRPGQSSQAPSVTVRHGHERR